MNQQKPVWSYFLIGVMSALFVSICVCFFIISTGRIDTKRLIVYSGTAEKAYDGQPLTSMQFGVSNGKLKDGHRLLVTPYGSQTEVGVSRNFFHYTIVDEEGSSVTKQYRIVEVPGCLVVHEPGWIDWDKVEKLKDYIDRFGNINFEAAGIDISDPSLGNMIREVDWNSLSPEEQEEKLGLMAAMLAASASGNPGELEQLLENIGAGESGGGGSSGGGNGSGGVSSDSRFNSKLQVEGEGLKENANNEVLQILTQNTGDYYLRYESFGDYNGTGFKEAKEYSNNIVSPLYLAGFSIFETAKNTFETIQIQNLDNSGAYYLPYYSITGVTSDFSDIRVSKKSDEYKLYSSVFDYINFSENYTISNQSISEIEQKYRVFVYNNYLTIDQDLKNELLSLTGFSSTGKQLAKDIKDYVQNAAEYNLDHAAFPEGEDMVLYFLTEGKEGICQHFAASATMIFRAYGIPARYTCGYKAKATANEWSVVTAKYAHAWVEIYVDGCGWVQVEVTGSGYDSARTNVISLRSVDATKIYDGQPFAFTDACRWEVIGGELISNHAVVGVYNEETQLAEKVGEYENSGFAYKIIDANTGNDVTNRYSIEQVEFGTLTITQKELTVYAESAEYEYSGEEISHKYVDCLNTEGVAVSDLPDKDFVLDTGDYICIQSSTTETEIGSYVNKLIYLIVDENGEDVTDQYILTDIDGKLEITKIKIEVITKDYEHQYDGENAICEEYELSEDTAHKIASEHYSSAKSGSTQILINEVNSEADNKFDVRIYDSSNQDITDDFYQIVYKYGKLKVIKRQILIKTGSDLKVDGGVTPAENADPESVVNAIDGSLPALLEEKGHKLVVDGKVPTRTEPGREENKCKYKVVDANNNDMSNYYEIKYEKEYGILEVRITIKITTQTKTFEYDHTKMNSATNSEYDATLLLPGHRLELVKYTERKACVKSMDNICEYKVVDENGKDVTGEYYNLEYKYGKITVRVSNPIYLTISTDSVSKEYDGTPVILENQTYTLIGEVGEGRELVVKFRDGVYEYNAKNPRVSTIKSCKVIEKGPEGTEVDVTAYYRITINGYLELIKRDISFETVDRDYTSRDEAVNGIFEGKEEDLIIKSGSLATGDEMVVEMEYITMEEVEQSSNLSFEKRYTANISIYDEEGNDVTVNYNISLTPGMLSVMI